MKAFVNKILPFFLILAGGLCVLRERFPQRFRFLPGQDAARFDWIFWILGFAGCIWLILRRFPEKAQNGENTGGGSFFRKYGIEIMILFITAASLSMLIKSGYYWDDAVNSTAYLAEKKDSVPTLTHVLQFMQDYLKLGRINVLSIYYYFFFYIENVSVYKALIILLILADQLVFRKVLLEFDVPLSGARLGMLLVPLMLQTRAYQDPVSGFYGLMQVLTAEMLLTALFLSRWLRTGRGRDLALSLLCFGIGLLTYEVCFPFLAMICLLIWVRRRNFLRALRDSLPFIGLTLLMLAAVFFVRKTYMDLNYEGVAFSPDPAAILRAGIRQTIAGLPLSFYTAAYQASVMDRYYPAASFMQYDLRSFLSAVSLTDLLIAAAAFFCLGSLHSSLKRRQEKMPELPVMGLSFALLPVITVAVSERYQGQLMPGLGYLPVYIQYYGIAMLLLWLTLRLKPSAGARALCLSAFAVILLLNLQNNRAVTGIMNRTFYDPRNAGEAALHGGILDFLPEDSVLFVNNGHRYLWESDWNNKGLYEDFYGNHARRIPAAVGDENVLKMAMTTAHSAGSETGENGSIELQNENIWVISYAGSSGRGMARLGRIRSLAMDPDSFAVRDITADKVIYFISGDFPEKSRAQYVTADGAFIQIGENDQYRVRGSSEGILYQLPEDELILFDSLTANLFYQ